MTAIGSTAYFPASSLNGAASIAPLSGTYDGGQLSDVELAQVFYQAGFRGEDLVTIVAIAKRESDGVSTAHNDNSRTRDDSYGLTQINMYGGNGPWLMERLNLTSPNQLLDPLTNAKAAFELAYMFDPPFRPWGPYKGESPTFNTDVPAARAAVAEAERQGLLDEPLQGGNVVASTSNPAAAATTAIVAATPAAASQPVLRIGARSEDVKDLQRQLKAAGFNPGPVDGWFGPKTQAAVRAFQHSRGIAVDGWVGPQTWAELDEVGGGGAAANGGRLTQGASGPQVKELQQMLQSLGYYHGNIGGNFGPQTDAAVRAFQRERGLAVDGWAGPQTMAALRQAAQAGGTQPTTPANPAPPTTGSERVQAALDFGRSVLGAPYAAINPYRFGEPWPGGRLQGFRGNWYEFPKGTKVFDCSGFVVACYRQAGVDLQQYGLGSSDDMRRDAQNSGGALQGVSREQLQPGDIITYRPKDGVGHVVIYMGDGMCIEAKGGQGVSINPVNWDRADSFSRVTA